MGRVGGCDERRFFMGLTSEELEMIELSLYHPGIKTFVDKWLNEEVSQVYMLKECVKALAAEKMVLLEQLKVLCGEIDNTLEAVQKWEESGK